VYTAVGYVDTFVIGTLLSEIYLVNIIILMVTFASKLKLYLRHFGKTNQSEIAYCYHVTICLPCVHKLALG